MEEVLTLDDFEFVVDGDYLFVITDKKINSQTFIYDAVSGDLYFNNIPPWDGLYWEMQADKSYLRVEG